MELIPYYRNPPYFLNLYTISVSIYVTAVIEAIV